MIKELHPKNFRGFEDHRLNFRELTIIVGANNAGKSTIVEALRLINDFLNEFFCCIAFSKILFVNPIKRIGAVKT